MRIVYLNPSGQLGGAETALLEMLAALRVAQPEWEFWLILGEDGPLARKADAHGVRVVLLPFPRALARLGDTSKNLVRNLPSIARGACATIRYLRSLALNLRSLRPDIIHTNGFKMHVLGAVAKPRGVRLLWHIHDYVNSRPVMSRSLRASRMRCSRAIVNSNSVGQDVKKLMPRLKTVILYNALDTNRFAPTGPRVDLDNLSGLPSADANVVRVGLVATFAHWKGHHTFLSALSKLLAFPVRGYIIGGPVYSTKGSQHGIEDLRLEANRLGIGRSVGFTGFIDDITGAMRALDILVHASVAPEPFGMAIIEGMACARAVVASRAGGATEIFEEGVEGLSHPPGDAAALADRILLLASDPQLRARLGQAARAKILAHFDRERLGREVSVIYRDICEGTPAEPAVALSAKA